MVNSQEIEKALQWRYACKKYDPDKKISASDWQLLTDAMAKAPSSYGLQPYKFLIIENQEARQKLREVSWNQAQVTDCSHYVVMITRNDMTEKDIDQYIQLVAKTRGANLDDLRGYRDLMVTKVVKDMNQEQKLEWTRRQAYIAMGFLLEAAALMQIDTTPIEGMDPKAYDDILNLRDSGYNSVAAVALGYRHKDDGYQNAKKVRRPKEDLFEVRK